MFSNAGVFSRWWQRPLQCLLLGLCCVMASLASAQPAAWVLQGQQACEGLLVGNSPNFLEGSRQRHYAKVAEVDTASLCRCTAEKFGQGMQEKGGDTDEAVLLERSMGTCLPHFAVLTSAQQQAVLQGPLAAQPLSAPAQAAEIQRCRDMAQGRYTPLGLDTLYLRAWEQEAGMQAAELCGVCVVSTMEDESAAARGAGQVWDQIKRDQTVAYSLHQCQHWNYRMKNKIQD